MTTEQFVPTTPPDEAKSGSDHTLYVVTEAERNQYGQEFVAACREKGLDAVAITDHHDLCLFKYIKKAAEQETDDDGEALRSRPTRILLRQVSTKIVDRSC